MNIEERKLIIQFIAYELRRNNSLPEAFKNCVDAFDRNNLTYKNIWDSYIENNSIVSSNNKEDMN